ncbi:MULTISPECIES: DUF1415 domain-containing protein [Vibrio]|uniref:DUF1415 family protein n=1 Tax=Vibrio algicola TaxID=2662262 RepID=A0A5Q0TCM3_9VIBR|nr:MULTISPECIES: DUF1415 domain-containing protein [Vibrio]MBD1577958.1 DUF1415 family protein [Vibrio sp. S11_S32]
MSTLNFTEIESQVEQWLIDVVIGLNLCPFAAKPQRNEQIRIFVSDAKVEEALLEDVFQEFTRLVQTPVSQLETTLVVIPNMLSDFDDYNFFLDWIDALVKQEQWEGTFQVATFHPDYCFAGAHPDDAENLTNRAPYPVLHLIREDSMAKAVKHYPNPEAIPDTNIARVESLSEQEKQQLFPHLFSKKDK